MNLYIVRHGQTDWNAKGLMQGLTDIELNQTGIEQANKTAELLKDINFSAIYSSPLKRAYTTANLINKYHNLNINIDNRIIERGFGNFEGTNLLKNIQNYWNYELNLSDNNIENIKSLFERVYDFLLELYNTYKDTNSNILLVTHGGVSIAVTAIINNITTNLLSIVIKNCEFRVFENIKLKEKEN